MDGMDNIPPMNRKLLSFPLSAALLSEYGGAIFFETRHVKVFYRFRKTPRRSTAVRKLAKRLFLQPSLCGLDALRKLLIPLLGEERQAPPPLDRGQPSRLDITL